MSLRLNIITLTILISGFAYGTPRSLTCVNSNKRTTLQVSFKKSKDELIAYAQLTTRSGRPLQTTTERFKLIKSSIPEKSGVKFEELAPHRHHYEAYQYPHRNLYLPGYLFTSRPRLQFKAELENYDVESLGSDWEFLNCQLD
jgi:hypothetical protein